MMPFNIGLVEDEFHSICVCNAYCEYREILFNKVENSENMSHTLCVS